MPTPEEMTIPDKLDSINATKQAIRQAIVDKGVEVPEGTTFYEYAGKIGEIEGGYSMGAWADPLLIDDLGISLMTMLSTGQKTAEFSAENAQVFWDYINSSIESNKIPRLQTLLNQSDRYTCPIQGYSENSSGVFYTNTTIYVLDKSGWVGLAVGFADTTVALETINIP